MKVSDNLSKQYTNRAMARFVKVQSKLLENILKLLNLLNSLVNRRVFLLVLLTTGSY